MKIQKMGYSVFSTLKTLSRNLRENSDFGKFNLGVLSEAVGASLTNGPKIPKIPSVWCSLSQRTLCAGAGLVNNSIQIVCVFVCVVRHQGGPAVGSKGINRDPTSQPASLINTLSRRARICIYIIPWES